MFVTRLLKVHPDCRSAETFVHCRPPGMPHGPSRTEVGCVTLEVRFVR